LARKKGYALMGTVDFDVLDAVDEFLAACELAGVCGSTGVETRVYIPEFSTREINSPGEPGISYHMGIGFVSSTCPPEVAGILDGMRQRAARRNRDMAGRVNAHLAPVEIDYDRDVLPLTPAGNATERHMLQAYVASAQASADDPAGFWGAKLGAPREQIQATMADPAKFQNLVRGKLMKKGGVGYVVPTPESFPTVEEFHKLIVACGALPCATWLDGTSAGEQAEEELIGLLVSKGVVALNIIPDRNWNLPDPEIKRIKVQNLYTVVELAAAWDLPLNIGTEMNSPGQRLVDDFAAPELAPVRQAFLDGAYFIYGHTAMQRALSMGYQSAWAQEHLPARRARNAFYTEAGKRIPPGRLGPAKLAGLNAQLTPAEVLEGLR
jgi:hypothetical protein